MNHINAMKAIVFSPSCPWIKKTDLQESAFLPACLHGKIPEEKWREWNQDLG
jgi:hypothetical protein